VVLLRGAAEKLENMINVLQPAAGTTGTTLNIAITNQVDGIKEPTQQESFDSSDRAQRNMFNNIDVSADASSVANWQPQV